MDSQLIILTLSFFLIAVVYASVGFGGGSSYLALLAQPAFMLSQDVIRPTALLCNIVVVSGASILFLRNEKLKWKEIWPFIAASVPLAWLGGFLRLDDRYFYLLLAFTLMVSSVVLWMRQGGAPTDSRERGIFTGAMTGGAIGFLSGLVGIGGGIFLSPFLNFIRWGQPKKIAALASVFILFNSVSGLAGQAARGFPSLSAGFLLPLLAAVLIGGQIGSRLALNKFSGVHIRRVTAVLIFIAALNILADHF